MMKNLYFLLSRRCKMIKLKVCATSRLRRAHLLLLLTTIWHVYCLSRVSLQWKAKGLHDLLLRTCKSWECVGEIQRHRLLSRVWLLQLFRIRQWLYTFRHCWWLAWAILMFLGTFWCVHEHFSVRFSYGVYIVKSKIFLTDKITVNFFFENLTTDFLLWH